MNNPLEQLSNHTPHWTWYGAYASGEEPLPDGILMANWNDIPSDLIDTLEATYDLVYDDEYTPCSECGRLIRTSPTSYRWTPSWYIFDNTDIICEACILNDDDLIERYINDHLNNPSKAITLDVDLIPHGFEQLNPEPFENGLHEGMNDSPERVLSTYRLRYPSKDFIFTMEASQFYVTFNIWGREKNNEGGPV